ncbi:MAG: sugar phosphate isomerase/epimerase [Candidatus Hydrogenedentes bacterium]|nr:sugar phosphate isomerase/epimerase [Candidatus Hydrogenedentota bacterium]
MNRAALRFSGVAALVALALLSCAGLPVQADDAGNPLAVRLASYGKFQDTAWEHLPTLGIHYIFLNVPKPDQIDEITKKLADHKLTALVMRGETDLSKETCVDELGVQLATCAKMDVKYMFISAKRNDAPKEVVIERLRKAGDIAKNYGVTITLETHPDLGTNGDVQVETMKAINHPNVRVNFDTGNITYYNKGADAVAELKKSIDYVGTVEFKDHDGGLESWVFPVLGQGIVKFPDVWKVLQTKGYKGPITIEFEGTKGVELTEEQTKEAIAGCVKYARSLGATK